MAQENRYSGLISSLVEANAAVTAATAALETAKNERAAQLETAMDAVFGESPAEARVLNATEITDFMVLAIYSQGATSGDANRRVERLKPFLDRTANTVPTLFRAPRHDDGFILAGHETAESIFSLRRDKETLTFGIRNSSGGIFQNDFRWLGRQPRTVVRWLEVTHAELTPFELGRTKIFDAQAGRTPFGSPDSPQVIVGQARLSEALGGNPQSKRRTPEALALLGLIQQLHGTEEGNKFVITKRDIEKIQVEVGSCVAGFTEEALRPDRDQTGLEKIGLPILLRPEIFELYDVNETEINRAVIRGIVSAVGSVQSPKQLQPHADRLRARFDNAPLSHHNGIRLDPESLVHTAKQTPRILKAQ